MVRVFAVVVLLNLFLASPLSAQAERVRITLKTSQGASTDSPRIVGTIVRVDEEAVTISDEGQKSTTVPRTAIALFERSQGERSRAKPITIGAIAGAVAGGIVADLIRKCSGNACSDTEAAKVWLWTHGGGLAGGLLGARVVAYERWTVAPLPQ